MLSLRSTAYLVDSSKSQRSLGGYTQHACVGDFENEVSVLILRMSEDYAQCFIRCSVLVYGVHRHDDDGLG